MGELTTGAKANIEQAKEYNLENDINPETGVYRFTEQEVESDDQLKSTLFDLLRYGVCYDENGEVLGKYNLALSVVTHRNENGEFINGAYDYVVVPVEVY
jgi:hypothetical protein